MSALPERLGRGVALTAHWLNRLMDWCRSQELRAGPGIKLTRTPTGTTVSAIAHAGGTSGIAMPARIVSCYNGVYDVLVYPAENIFWNRKKLTLPEVNSRAALKTGTWVLAHSFKSPAAPIRQEVDS